MPSNAPLPEAAEPLFVFDKNEWWDVVHWLDPSISRVEFDTMWADFEEKKRRKEMH